MLQVQIYEGQCAVIQEDKGTGPLGSSRACKLEQCDAKDAWIVRNCDGASLRSGILRPKQREIVSAASHQDPSTGAVYLHKIRLGQDRQGVRRIRWLEL